MEKGKPRLARLAAVLTQLQANRRITAREIAEKHGISIRTVYRDIRTLELSGVPIITEEGLGYSIMEGYRLPPVSFTEEEAGALITAGQLMDHNRDRSLSEEYKQAITKIKSVLRHNQKEKVELLSGRIQVRTNEKEKRSSHYLIQLQKAITNYTPVHIRYLSLTGKNSERNIEPFALYTTRNNWRLIAFCRLKKNFRAFRPDSLQSRNVHSEQFTPHDITVPQ